jgi:hypothetical protein
MFAVDYVLSDFASCRGTTDSWRQASLVSDLTAYNYAGCVVECDQLDSPPCTRGGSEADGYSDVDGDVGRSGVGAGGLAVILITKDDLTSTRPS